MILKLTYVVTYIKASFPFLAELYTIWMCILYLVCQFSFFWVFGLFYLLVVVNRVVMNLCIHISVSVHVFNSSECIHRSGMAASYCSCISNRIRNYQAVFLRGCTISCSFNSIWEIQLLYIFTNVVSFSLFLSSAVGILIVG